MSSPSWETFSKLVQTRFRSQPDVYRKFLDLDETFRGGSIAHDDYRLSIVRLLHGHQDLIVKFNYFLHSQFKHQLSNTGSGDHPSHSNEQEYESEGDQRSASDDFVSHSELQCTTRPRLKSGKQVIGIVKKFSAPLEQVDGLATSQQNLERLRQRMERSKKNIEQLKLALSEEKKMSELYHRQLLAAEDRIANLSTALTDTRNHLKLYHETKHNMICDIESGEMECLDLEDGEETLVNGKLRFEAKFENRDIAVEKEKIDRDECTAAGWDDRPSLLKVEALEQKCVLMQKRIDEADAVENNIRDSMRKCVSSAKSKLAGVQLKGESPNFSEILQGMKWNDYARPLSKNVAAFCSEMETLFDVFSMCNSRMEQCQTATIEVKYDTAKVQEEIQKSERMESELKRKDKKIHEFVKITRVAETKQKNQRLEISNLREKADKLNREKNGLGEQLQSVQADLKKKTNDHTQLANIVAILVSLLQCIRDQMIEGKITAQSPQSSLDALSVIPDEEVVDCDSKELCVTTRRLVSEIMVKLEADRKERGSLAMKLHPAECRIANSSGQTETVTEKTHVVRDKADNELLKNRNIKPLKTSFEELMYHQERSFPQKNGLQDSHQRVTLHEGEKHHQEETEQQASHGEEDCELPESEKHTKLDMEQGEVWIKAPFELDSSHAWNQGLQDVATDQETLPSGGALLTLGETNTLIEPKHNLPSPGKLELFSQKEVEALLGVLQRLSNEGSTLASKINQLSLSKNLNTDGQSLEDNYAQQLGQDGQDFLRFAFVRRKDVLESMSLILSSLQVNKVRPDQEWRLLISIIMSLTEKHEFNSALVTNLSVSDKSAKPLMNEMDEVVKQTEICKTLLEELC